MRLRYPHLLVALLLLMLLTALLSSAGFTPTQAQTLPAGAGSGAGHSSPLRAANVTAATFPATMSEDFESSWPSSGWTLSDLSSTDGGEFLWGRNNCNPHGGGYAGWSVGGGAQGSLKMLCATPPDYYPDNTLTRAVYGPFDLSDVTSATVTYYIWGSTEWDTINRRDYCKYDSFTIEGYTDAGSVARNRYCGDWTNGTDGNGYYKETLNLTPLIGPGQGNAWLKLEFSSDPNGPDIGMLVDDITLSVTHQPPPTNTPTSTPTNTPTNTPIGTPANAPTSTPTNTPTNTVGPLTHRSVYLPIAIRALPPPPTPTPTPMPPPTTACPDVEPNEDPEHGQQLTTVNKSCIGSFQTEQVGKVDYYWVRPNSGQHVIVDLTGIPSGANYDINLIKEESPGNYFTVAASANPGQANEHVDYVADSNKRYFIRVRATAKSTSANNAYILTVAIQ